MKFLILILLVSCGKEKSRERCYNKTEAKMMCMSDYLSDGFTSMQADIYCAPLYVVDACYSKGGL